MNVVKFEPKDCERIRELLDSFVSDELLVETNHEVLRHLERCEACAEALDARVRVRRALRDAVRADEAPSALADAIRQRVRATPRARQRRWTLAPWLAVAAAVLLVGSAGLLGLRAFRSDAPPSTAVALDPIDYDSSILRIGLGDHTHCALQRPLPSVPATAQAMVAALGPEYAGLVPLVVDRMPKGFEMVEAHMCRFQERRFVHLICRNGDAILSIIVTKKNGESFDRKGVFAVLAESGIPVYRTSTQGLEVDGIETRDHLAFVVSGLAAERNFQLAANLVPSVHDYLARLEA